MSNILETKGEWQHSSVVFRHFRASDRLCWWHARRTHRPRPNGRQHGHLWSGIRSDILLREQRIRSVALQPGLTHIILPKLAVRENAALVQWGMRSSNQRRVFCDCQSKTLAYTGVSELKTCIWWLTHKQAYTSNVSYYINKDNCFLSITL